MKNFMKIINSTFVSLNNFIYEVQEIGCIEKGCFSYSILSNISDITAVTAYCNSVKKLLEILTEVLEQLNNPLFAVNSESDISFSDEECSQENGTSLPCDKPLEFYSTRSHTDIDCLKASEMKESQYQPYQNYDQCQSTDLFAKTNNFISSDECTKKYSETPLHQQVVCPPNTLITPFENMALNPLSERGSVYVEASKQNMNTDNSTFPHCSIVSCNPAFINTGTSLMNSADVSVQTMSSQLPLPQITSISASEETTILNGGKLYSEDDRQGKTANGEHCLDTGKRNTLPVFCCKTCNSTSTTLSSFEAHMCRVANDESQDDQNVAAMPKMVVAYNAKILSFQFPAKALITTMKKLEQVKKFVCDCCGVEFRSLSRIVYHLPRCSPGPYPCNICSSIFLNLKHLNYHKKKSHRGEKCFTCDECSKSFLRKASLRKHCVNSHESKSFRNGSSKTQETTASSYKCDFCHKQFIKKIFLTNHQLRMHGLDKKFLCQVCGKKLMTSNSLMTHMDLHKGEKKFECTYCDRQFRRKEKLLHHERTHTGERPFECGRCEKAFVSKGRLNEHIRRHDAEKRFECPQCDRTYASSWDLKKHMKKKHQLEVPTQYLKVVLKRSDQGHSQVNLLQKQ